MTYGLMLYPWLKTDIENCLTQGQNPTQDIWTDDTWLIQTSGLYASIPDNPEGLPVPIASCCVDRGKVVLSLENYLLWAHASKTSALNLGQSLIRHTPFYYALIFNESEDSSKRNKNRVQNTHSLYKMWEVWEIKNEPFWHLWLSIRSTHEGGSQMRMTKSKHLKWAIWKGLTNDRAWESTIPVY